MKEKLTCIDTHACCDMNEPRVLLKSVKISTTKVITNGKTKVNY